jgi:hypothetical protein
MKSESLRERVEEYADKLRREKDKHYINTLCAADDLDAILSSPPAPQETVERVAHEYILAKAGLSPESTFISHDPERISESLIFALRICRIF